MATAFTGTPALMTSSRHSSYTRKRDMQAEQSEELFPLPPKDPFFAEILRIKKRLAPSHPLYSGAGLQHVYEFS